MMMREGTHVALVFVRDDEPSRPGVRPGIPHPLRGSSFEHTCGYCGEGFGIWRSKDGVVSPAYFVLLCPIANRQRAAPYEIRCVRVVFPHLERGGCIGGNENEFDQPVPVPQRLSRDNPPIRFVQISDDKPQEILCFAPEVRGRFDAKLPLPAER